ncbi:hypothetical protein B0T09DRAFT_374718 [Sordaria sp. MPI-SDFR-AT-0083]|nr:hypothetical protein B0T09DRAFT_374718 [Sordaria sp. MPI-SDFR-AT-0083]
MSHQAGKLLRDGDSSRKKRSGQEVGEDRTRVSAPSKEGEEQGKVRYELALVTRGGSFIPGRYRKFQNPDSVTSRLLIDKDTMADRQSRTYKRGVGRSSGGRKRVPARSDARSTVGSQAGSYGGRGSSAAPVIGQGTTSERPLPSRPLPSRPLPSRPLFLRQCDLCTPFARDATSTAESGSFAVYDSMRCGIGQTVKLNKLVTVSSSTGEVLTGRDWRRARQSGMRKQGDLS